MHTKTSLYVIDSDPAPVVEYGGTKEDIPIIRFPSLVGTEAEIFLSGKEDLPGWLRAFAARLNEFADQVEERS